MPGRRGIGWLLTPPHDPHGSRIPFSLCSGAYPKQLVNHQPSGEPRAGGASSSSGSRAGPRPPLSGSSRISKAAFEASRRSAARPSAASSASRAAYASARSRRRFSYSRARSARDRESRDGESSFLERQWGWANPHCQKPKLQRGGTYHGHLKSASQTERKLTQVACLILQEHPRVYTIHMKICVWTRRFVARNAKMTKKN